MLAKYGTFENVRLPANKALQITLVDQLGKQQLMIQYLSKLFEIYPMSFTPTLK